MTQDKALIKGLKKLRQIKPSHDWVVFNKNQILGQDTLGVFNFPFFPYLKPAFAGLMVLLVVFGVSVSANNSLPGDPLYFVKRAYEKTLAVFVSDDEKPGYQMELANARLEDLAKASAKNLAPTINEFQASISQAAKNLSGMTAATSNPVAMKKIVKEAKKLEENKQKVESLGVIIEDGASSEFDSAMSKIVENIIEDMEGRILSEDKTDILGQMKTLFSEEKYSESLELYLINQ